MKQAKGMIYAQQQTAQSSSIAASRGSSNESPGQLGSLVLTGAN
eukprot:CAMPEP_0185594192 /NCGR_PEP_ID=MMETSP0434-20130131/73945_1 /TAXON_ID=626734 ORGANISM="Favella taraikaensis, Strain Fe Narragansett Bay" /NCGR_SAMPLE_ID=MMETSP0434 /ASSEMBLY_ACC=CAM_ASM_000379 /LENGTH=43 /DNA_ID= /DNA_START= /DNA_END= /DNA_ORIENTATION=